MWTTLQGFHHAQFLSNIFPIKNQILVFLALEAATSYLLELWILAREPYSDGELITFPQQART